MAGKRLNLIWGAVIGAALVAIPTILIGRLLEEPAHPAVVAAFALFGAVLGVYAWGVVAYQWERDTELP